MTPSLLARLSWVAVLVAGCVDTASAGGDHAHGGGDDHADHAEEGESIAITRWTATHELFVELDAPVQGRAFAYHAHVTRMADNHAADSGTLTIRWEQDGFPVESHTDPSVARAGIFAAEAPPPPAGRYRLVFAYADGDERAEWDGGTVEVGAGAPVAHDGEDEGEIAFLKETQWQVPFAVAPATERPVVRELHAAGVVAAAPEETAVVAAPVDGLVAWADALPVVGRRVRQGERLATLVPAGAAEHWSSLRAAVATTRADRDLARATLARLEALPADTLVSQRRLDEARAELARAEAEASAARGRAAVLTSGGSGAVAIRAPADGLLVQVGAPHGAAVSAGAPLLSVQTGDGLLIDAHVHDRGPHELRPVASLSATAGSTGRVDLLALGGTVLTEELVTDPHTLSAPLLVRAPAVSGLRPGDLVELSVGVGSASPALTIPRSAVVEINGQDVVFVQKTGESFTRRRVVLGDGNAHHVTVERGIQPGDMVVTEGGFDVHVASLSGALESHRH